MTNETILQSRSAFYVCIRIRRGRVLEARWPPGGGAYKNIEAARKGIVEAIEKYGPEYHCVIEPVEYQGVANDQLDAEVQE